MSKPKRTNKNSSAGVTAPLKQAISPEAPPRLEEHVLATEPASPLASGDETDPATSGGIVAALEVPATSDLSSTRELIRELQTHRDALILELKSLEGNCVAQRRQHAVRLADELAADRKVADEKHAIAIGQLQRESDRLRERATELREECAQAKTKGLEIAERGIGELRVTRMEELDTEIASMRKTFTSAVEEQRATAVSELKTRVDAVEVREKEVATRERDARAMHVRANNELSIAEENRLAADELRKAEVKRATESLKAQLRQAQLDCESELKRSANLEAKVAELVRREREFGGRSASDILKNLSMFEDQCGELKEQLAARPTSEQVERFEADRKHRDELLKRNERLESENGTLNAQRVTLLNSAGALENQARLREAEEQRRKAVEGQLEKMSIEVDKLRSLHEKPKEAALRVREIQKPILPLQPIDINPKSELEWLSKIEAGCRQTKVQFQPRLLHAFHTSLKTGQWSPLTVLSGVSGTGKSMLPKLYSRYGGLNFLMVPVQPNWDSPQSVFGFFNSVDNRFNATPLLRLIAQCARAPGDGDGLKQQLTLVLLDEMNLAHVELYFSDMLSKLEDRRGDDRLPTLEIDIGADAERLKIPLESNLLWCGTMNEDETTKALSDKVLDRGNLLVFPRPVELIRRTDASLGTRAKPLDRARWDSWVQPKSPFELEEIGPFKERLEAISQHMESAGRAIGHRVWQSVEYYMANHPLVLHARSEANTDETLFAEAMDRAFEDQIVQKVMPKLRGIETRGASLTRCLDPIRKELDSGGMACLAEDYAAALSSGFDTFAWRSAKYLDSYIDEEKYAVVEAKT